MNGPIRSDSEDDRMLSPPGLQEFSSRVEAMGPESIPSTTLHADRAGDALAYPTRDPRLVMSAGHAHDDSAHQRHLCCMIPKVRTSSPAQSAQITISLGPI